MGFALVGTIGAASLGSGNTAVTPAWGTGENRTAGNNLILLCAGMVANTLPTTPAGWTVVAQFQGTVTSATIFERIATGGDATPTIAAATGTRWACQLAEFSGGDGTTVADQIGGASGTTSPRTATAGARDTAGGELVIICGSANTGTATATTAHTPNNGLSLSIANNDSTSSNAHYSFGWGVTTSNSAADSDRLTVTAGTLLGMTVAIASFKLAGSVPPIAQRLPQQIGPRAVGPTYFAQRQLAGAQAPSAQITNKTLSATASTSGVLAQTTGHQANATQAQQVTLPRIIGHTLTVGQATAASLASQTSRSVAATQASASSLSRTVSVQRTLSQTSTSSVSRQLASARTLTATQTSTPSVSRQAGVTRSVSQTTGVTLSRSISTSVAFAQGTSTTIAKGVTHALTSSQASPSSILAGRASSRTFSVTQTQALSVTSLTAYSRTTSQGTSVTLRRAVATSIGVTQSSTVTASHGNQQSRTLTATQTQTVRIQSADARTLTAGQAQQTSTRPSLSLQLSAAQGTTLRLDAPSVSHTLASNQSTAPSVQGGAPGSTVTITPTAGVLTLNQPGFLLYRIPTLPVQMDGASGGGGGGGAFWRGQIPGKSITVNVSTGFMGLWTPYPDLTTVIDPPQRRAWANPVIDEGEEEEILVIALRHFDFLAASAA